MLVPFHLRVTVFLQDLGFATRDCEGLVTLKYCQALSQLSVPEVYLSDIDPEKFCYLHTFFPPFCQVFHVQNRLSWCYSSHQEEEFWGIWKWATWQQGNQGIPFMAFISLQNKGMAHGKPFLLGLQLSITEPPLQSSYLQPCFSGPLLDYRE